VLLMVAGLAAGGIGAVAVFGRPMRPAWAVPALPMLPVPGRAPAPAAAPVTSDAPSSPARAALRAAAAGEPASRGSGRPTPRTADPQALRTADPRRVDPPARPTTGGQGDHGEAPVFALGDGRPLTVQALEPLTREGWIVLRDLPASWGVRGIVVIGPGGLFLIDSRALEGEITVNGDHVTAVRSDGQRYRRDVGGRVRANADALFRDLRSRGRLIQPVLPLVALWGEFPAGVADTGDVTFVAGPALVDHLRARPARLTPDRIAEVAISLHRTAHRLAA